MTEITNNNDVKPLEDMSTAVQRFILHWGDMGGTWGVNRTVAQIHALLYISERPLNAEDITAILGVARSNVSNSLKELMSIKTIRRVPIAGDRRDHFEAETDVWEIAKRVAAERKAREIDPALETLTFCVNAAKDDPRVSAEQKRRLQNMQEFTGTMDRWYTQMQSIPTSTLYRLIHMGDKVVGLLNFVGGKKDKPPES